MDVAHFATRDSAEAAWSILAAGGVPGAVLSDQPPWGSPGYRVQCARKDATAALQLLAAARAEDA